MWSRRKSALLTDDDDSNSKFSAEVPKVKKRVPSGSPSAVSDRKSLASDPTEQSPSAAEKAKSLFSAGVISAEELSELLARDLRFQDETAEQEADSASETAQAAPERPRHRSLSVGATSAPPKASPSVASKSSPKVSLTMTRGVPGRARVKNGGGGGGGDDDGQPVVPGPGSSSPSSWLLGVGSSWVAGRVPTAVLQLMGSDAERQGWVLKATAALPPGLPKPKHARRLILALWDGSLKSDTLFAALAARPWRRDPVVALKLLALVLKVAQQVSFHNLPPPNEPVAMDPWCAFWLLARERERKRESERRQAVQLEQVLCPALTRLTSR